MKVLYLIQSFKAPEQIYRLVQIIKKTSLGSHIVVSHDFTACDLDITPLQVPGVEVLALSGKGGRGDFSMLQGYLDALDWLFSHNTDFDWVINLSGQDYPTQPLPQIEKFLAATKYDGFLEYFDAFSDSKHNSWGSREARNRYLYNYWRSGVYIPPGSLQSKILNRLGLVIENAQSFIRTSWIYDCLMLGSIATSTPFNKNFLCYGGSYYHALSRKCVQFLYEYSRGNPDFVNYYRKTICPNESFIQTVLVNSGLFNLCNDCKRYLDFSSPEDSSRPRTLTSKDYSALIKDDIHFARKFDSAQDKLILDMLDARILQDN